MRLAPLLLLLALCGALVACGGGDDDDDEAGKQPATQSADPRVPEPGDPAVFSALAALPGGKVLAGELVSGTVRELPGRRVVARVPVKAGGQRGLLGLAIDGDGGIYAASTAEDLRLVVDRIAPGERERIYDGPKSTELGIGGHIAFADDGRLLLGIGDLGGGEKIDDPEALNGKLVSLDPEGSPDQRPRILSGGWHNPFAFDLDERGRVWIADNAPGTLPERIGRGDGEDRAITVLDGRRAPSGVAMLSPRALALCGVVSGKLERFRRDAGGRWKPAGTIARDCRYGVLKTSDGRLAVSGSDGVRFVTP
ncbi:MAG: PQQ-dependent sugar dehydrogenase [Solirubrobacteraceae bacterium]